MRFSTQYDCIDYLMEVINEGRGGGGGGVSIDAIADRSISGKITINAASTSQYAFYRCTEITEADIFSTFIGAGAFNGCTSMKKVTLEDPTTISSNAFQNCTGLEEVIFKGTPSTLNPNAFSNCTQSNLTIYVPWSDGDVAGAPWGATNATVIYDNV